MARACVVIGITTYFASGSEEDSAADADCYFFCFRSR